MLGLIPDVTGPVPVVAELGGGVTNTSDTLLPSSSAIGLDGGVWKDSDSFSNSARVCRTRSGLVCVCVIVYFLEQMFLAIQ
jgi:hypothetical protein